MTDYNDGKWHGWNGGECPVHPQTIVDVVYFANAAFGNKITNAAMKANQVTWESQMAPVIAFRVVKPYREPRVIWVNEWSDGAGYAYSTRQRAESNKDSSPFARTAVRYVEQPE